MIDIASFLLENEKQMDWIFIPLGRLFSGRRDYPYYDRDFSFFES